MFYVYLLKSRKKGKTYVGCTENLRRRFAEHNKGFVIATKRLVPLDLVYYEAYRSKEDATKREWNLKRFAKGYGQLKSRIAASLALGEG